jgi:hypothetical protein
LKWQIQTMICAVGTRQKRIKRVEIPKYIVLVVVVVNIASRLQGFKSVRPSLVLLAGTPTTFPSASLTVKILIVHRDCRYSSL